MRAAVLMLFPGVFEYLPAADSLVYELGLRGGVARRPLARVFAIAVTSGVYAMISLLPEDVIRSAVQLACYGFAAFTAVVAFMFTPRW